MRKIAGKIKVDISSCTWEDKFDLICNQARKHCLDDQVIIHHLINIAIVSNGNDDLELLSIINNAVIKQNINTVADLKNYIIANFATSSSDENKFV